MSEYTLSVGGDIDDPDSDVYDDQVDLSVTQSASSIDSWNATLASGGFSDDLLEPVWIYHTPSGSNDDVIFQGEFETFETDYQTGTTTISGKGPLTGLDQDVISRTFSNTTAYDAIRQLWAGTEFDALVNPPNSDEFDETYHVEFEHRKLWGYLGTDPDSVINTNNIYVDRNHIVFEQPNLLLDDVNDYGNQARSIQLDQSSDRVWLRIETTDPVPWLRAGLRQHNGQLGEGTIEKVTQTNDYNTPQDTHLFELKFASSDVDYRPLVEIGDYTTEITRTDVIVPDQSDFSTLDDVEINGTRLDVLQELHDLASYEFTISDYANLDVRSFPRGAVGPEPDWDIVSATRSKSFENYANSVTVEGETTNGSAPTASASDQTEIDLLQREIETFEKDPQLSTQSEVDDRAQRLLDESIAERDEGGTLEVAPEFVPVGYTYNVSPWGDAFPHGGQIGSNSLYFDGTSSIEWTWGGKTQLPNDESLGDYRTLEAMIHPQQLDQMGDNEFQVLWWIGADMSSRIDSRFFVRLYGDGSLGLGTKRSDEQFQRTEPNIINNDTPQRLSVMWDNGLIMDPIKVYVDGQLESDTASPTSSFDLDNGVFVLGSDLDGNNGFVGGVDDVRVWAEYDGYRPESLIREHLYDDLVTKQIDFTYLPFYFRFDDRLGGIDNSGIARGVTINQNTAEYQSAYGQLEEVQYALGTGNSISLDFDISGRIDTELIDTRRQSRTTLRRL
jgi:hypothetical protein